MVKQELKKYSQRLNIAIAVLSAILGLLPFWQPQLGSHYTLVFTITSMLSTLAVAKKQNL